MNDCAAPAHYRSMFDIGHFQQVCAWAKNVLNTFPDIQAVAGCGHSGLPLASVLSHDLSLHLIAVRRKLDYPTGDKRIVHTNSPMPFSEYLIVDDLIDSGKTILHMIQQIHTCNITKYPLPAAILLTSTSRWHTHSEEVNHHLLGRHFQEYFPMQSMLYEELRHVPIYNFGDTL